MTRFQMKAESIARAMISPLRGGLNPEKRTLREKASCCRITVTGGIYFEKKMDKHEKAFTNNNQNAK